VHPGGDCTDARGARVARQIGEAAEFRECGLGTELPTGVDGAAGTSPREVVSDAAAGNEVADHVRAGHERQQERRHEEDGGDGEPAPMMRCGAREQSIASARDVGDRHAGRMHKRHAIGATQSPERPMVADRRESEPRGARPQPLRPRSRVVLRNVARRLGVQREAPATNWHKVKNDPMHDRLDAAR